jgi:hypothetical protein
MKQHSAKAKQHPARLAGVNLQERDRLMAQAYLARSEYVVSAIARAFAGLSKAVHSLTRAHPRDGLAH